MFGLSRPVGKVREPPTLHSKNPPPGGFFDRGEGTGNRATANRDPCAVFPAACPEPGPFPAHHPWHSINPGRNPSWNHPAFPFSGRRPMAGAPLPSPTAAMPARVPVTPAKFVFSPLAGEMETGTSGGWIPGQEPGRHRSLVHGNRWRKNLYRHQPHDAGPGEALAATADSSEARLSPLGMIGRLSAGQRNSDPHTGGK